MKNQLRTRSWCKGGPTAIQSYVEIGSAGPPDKENLVEFHLLYSGPLHSAGKESPRKEKHNSRKVFHSQLRHLWETHSNLRERVEGEGEIGMTREAAAALPPGELFQRGARELGSKWNRGGFNFLPLVTRKLCLRCGLDILFLRAEDRNFVLQGGDIDGRLKILFDFLRMADVGELPAGATPEADEEPFFVLLQNDDLISEVRVNTDRLLNLPGVKTVDKHDVYLQITVRLNPTVNRADTWMFE